MALIYLSWAVYVGGLAFLVLQEDYALALIWVILLPLAWWAYIRAFPAISRYIGYGSVADRPAQGVGQAPVKVTFYTALGCPFCPVVKRRILALQAAMGFDLEEVDVTLKPDLLRARGIWAVAVVEVGEQRLVGHATSQQLAALVRDSRSAERAPAQTAKKGVS